MMLVTVLVALVLVALLYVVCMAIPNQVLRLLVAVVGAVFIFCWIFGVRADAVGI